MKTRKTKEVKNTGDSNGKTRKMGINCKTGGF